MDEQRLAGGAVRGAPRPPAGRRLPDARLAERGRRRRPGGWLRLSRADTSEVENLRAWLTTVVARVCLNMLRSRRTRREEPLDVRVPDPVVSRDGRDRPRARGAAGRLGRAGAARGARDARARRAAGLRAARHVRRAVRRDRGRSWAARRPRPGSSPAARAAGSRAPRRCPTPTSPRQREVVDAFFAAARDGDFDALVAVLDPDVVLALRRRRLRARSAVVVRGARGGGRAGAHLRAARAVRPPGARQRRRRRRRGPARRAVLGHGLHSRGREDRRDRRDHRPGAAARSWTWPCSTTDALRARWRARPRRPAAPTPSARRPRAGRLVCALVLAVDARRRPRRVSASRASCANSTEMTGSREPVRDPDREPGGRSRSALQPSTVGMKPLIARIPAGVGRPAPSPSA